MIVTHPSQSNRHSTLILGAVLLAFCTAMPLPSHAAPLPDFVISPGVNATSCAPLTQITGGCELLIAGTYTDAAGNGFQIVDASTTSNKAKIQIIDCAPICKLILSGVSVVASGNVTNARITYSHTFDNSTLDTNLRVRHEEAGGFSLAFLPTNTITRTATFTAQVQASGCSDPCAAAPANVGSRLSSGSFPTIPRSSALYTSSAAALTVTGTITINSLKTGEKATNLVDTIQTGSQNNLPADVGNLQKCFLNENPDLTPLPGTIVRGDASDASEDRICYVPEIGGMQLLTGIEVINQAGADQGSLTQQQLRGR